MLCAVLAASACKSHRGASTGTGRALGARIPTVDAVEATGIPSGSPPLLVLLDERGNISVAAGPASWADLSSFDPGPVAKPMSLDDADRLTREADAMEWTPQEAIAHIGKPVDLSELPAEDEGEPSANAYGDPPPPPPPPPPGDQAVTTDSKRDVRANAAGGFGSRFVDLDLPLDTRHGAMASMAKFLRLATVVGEVQRDRHMGSGYRAVVLADPRGKARDLVEVVAGAESPIAVSHAGHVVPLRIDFRRRGDQLQDQSWWTEVRVASSRLVIEAVPGKPVELTWSTGPVDRPALKEAIASVRKAAGLDEQSPVDVLVDTSVDVQHLVDVVVALDQAGVSAIGLGQAPVAGSVYAQLRGQPVVEIVLTRFDTESLERRAVSNALGARPGIEACYRTALAAAPDLGGVVVATMVVGADGAVVEARTDASDERFGRCLVDELRRARLPAPPTGRAEIKAWFSLSPDVRRREP